MKTTSVLAALAVASLSNAAAIQARQSTTCYSGAYIICARGTFEQQSIPASGFGFQDSLVTALLKAIPNSNASAVIYPAGFPYPESVQTGALNAQQQIVQYAQACPNSKIVLLGYSQGAQVIGQSITGGPTYIPVLGGMTLPTPPLPDSYSSNIVALNLLGDPNRDKSQGLDQDPMTCTTSSSTPRNGTLYTNFQPYSNRLSEFCHQGDPVCCTDGSDAGSHVGYLFNQDNVNKMISFIVDKVNNGP